MSFPRVNEQGASAPLPTVGTQAGDTPKPKVPWVVVVMDDPVNTMDWVTYVFQRSLGHPPHKAEQLMLTVHTSGWAVVAEGGREKAEQDVVAMHILGLQATCRPGN